MSIVSLEFFLLLLAAAIIHSLLPTRNIALRQIFLATLSAGFLATQLPDVWAAVATIGFALVGYWMARLLAKYPRTWLLSTYIILLIGAFLVLKRYSFLTLLVTPDLLAEVPLTVGLSYILFRQIHVAVDTSQGEIGNLTLWCYMNYQFNLFGLLAGPIQRYQDFAEQFNTNAQPLLTSRALLALIRICVGIIKMTIVAAVFDKYVTMYQRRILEAEGVYSMRTAIPIFAMLFYVYPAYIYANFSGYCDIVIGGASVFDIQMPENFDNPLLSRNMIDYWTRWHRTLGFWIRDYLFLPLYKSLAYYFPGWTTASAVITYFVALLVTGIWHGSTTNFVVFGLLNGLGVSIAKLWETIIIRAWGRKGLKTYLQSQPIRILMIVITLHYVMFTMFFFSNANVLAAYRVLGQ